MAEEVKCTCAGKAWNPLRPFSHRDDCPIAGGDCRGCGKPLLRANQTMADGCPCNAPRGVNHELVPYDTCTCELCDPKQTGSSRIRAAEQAKPSPPDTGLRHPAVSATLAFLRGGTFNPDVMRRELVELSALLEEHQRGWRAAHGIAEPSPPDAGETEHLREAARLLFAELDARPLGTVGRTYGHSHTGSLNDEQFAWYTAEKNRRRASAKVEQAPLQPTNAELIATVRGALESEDHIPGESDALAALFELEKRIGGERG